MTATSAREATRRWRQRQKARAREEARKREAAAYGAQRYVDVSRAELMAETLIPGWAWECATRNVAERHDSTAVRPS